MGGAGVAARCTRRADFFGSSGEFSLRQSPLKTTTLPDLALKALLHATIGFV